MTIELIPFNYCKFTYDWINRPDAWHFPSSFQCLFLLLTFFPFLFFQDISYEILEIFPRSLYLDEVEGKAISRDQAWIELKVTLVTEILRIDILF